LSDSSITALSTTHLNFITAIAVSETYVVSGSYDGSICVNKTSDLSLLTSFKITLPNVLGASITSMFMITGSIFAVGCGDGHVLTYYITGSTSNDADGITQRSDVLMTGVINPMSPVLSVSCSSDGNILASSHKNGSISILRQESNAVPTVLPPKHQKETYLSFAVHGDTLSKDHRLVSASQEGFASGMKWRQRSLSLNS
jgi:WD40 repeat protein